MKKHTDNLLLSIDQLTLDVILENKRQVEKWGVQTHELPAWLMFLTEEVGELAEAIAENEYRDGEPDEIKAEAIQVATLALKIAEIAQVVIDCDGMPRMTCPKCGRVSTDWDGLGVLYCEKCGYCTHASSQGNDAGDYICDSCGEVV
jgi:NTP pyrophosphatase (non-canonical NTP hydrolase)